MKLSKLIEFSHYELKSNNTSTLYKMYKTRQPDVLKP